MLALTISEKEIKRVVSACMQLRMKQQVIITEVTSGGKEQHM